MSPRKPLLLVLGLAGGFLLAEIGVRAFGPPEPQGPPLSSFLEPHEDPALRFLLRASTEKPFGRGIVRTNAERRRVLDPSAAAPEGPPGGLRVAVIGDSTCFGWRLPYERTYVPQLHALLGERLGQPVELRNHCVPGYDAGQATRVLQTQVLPWEPHFVLWHYDHNDAHPGVTRRGIDSPSKLVRMLRRRMLQLDDHGLTPDDEVLAVDGSVQLASGPAYDAHLEDLDEGLALLRARGIPHLFLVFDSVLDAAGHDDLHHTRLHAPLRAFLDERDVDVLDLFDPLQARMSAQGWTDLSPQYLSHEPLDAHPDRFGHQWLAELLVEELIERFGPPSAGR